MTLRLAEYQADADEADADQRTLQRGGRPVHREYADDPRADADEDEQAVTCRAPRRSRSKPSA